MAENKKDNKKENENVKMTFEQYILNPMGKNNAVLNGAVRELMRKQYIHKFDNLMIREHGAMEYHLYIDSAKNQYWAHIKVPSETVEHFYYDVVLKFFIDASKGGTNDLFKWDIQFYSNDPAFVYTYAHVFVDKEYFIPELKSKMSREALTTAPSEKNPNNDVGYVKTIYFAYLLMENRKLNKLNRFEAEAQPLYPKNLLNDITPADEKINDRQEKGKSVSKRKKKNIDKYTLRNIQRVVGKDADLSRLQVTTTKKVNTIKSTASSNNTKNIKTTKRVNKK